MSDWVWLVAEMRQLRSVLGNMERRLAGIEEQVKALVEGKLKEFLRSGEFQGMLEDKFEMVEEERENDDEGFDYPNLSKKRISKFARSQGARPPPKRKAKRARGTSIRNFDERPTRPVTKLKTLKLWTLFKEKVSWLSSELMKEANIRTKRSLHDHMWFVNKRYMKQGKRIAFERGNRGMGDVYALRDIEGV